MDTRSLILETAQRLIQKRGFNGFSYADIAKEVGIRKASLHYHFASKADLGSALLQQYTEQLNGLLDQTKDLTAMERLESYVGLYRHNLSSGRMCLGGMMGSEALTLNEEMLPGIQRFFDLNIRWLTSVIEEGQANGELNSTADAASFARIVLTTLQGSLLLARATGETDAFDQDIAVLLKQLSGNG